MTDIAIIGGGAAGFFAAINIKIKSPRLHVVILEKSRTVLGKVRISGGGRCNVTHACFNVPDLVQFYPRGRKELYSVFSRFNPQHTIQWFKEHGVTLKTEGDGRMFPTTDDSESIVNCFLEACRQLNIPIRTECPVQQITPLENGFEIHTTTEIIKANKVVVTTGSSDHFWQMLRQLGHTLVAPVPSLFTFNIQHPLIAGLQGVSIPNVKVKLLLTPEICRKTGVNQKEMEQTGPLLFTHWGLSGPAILKLSAVGARVLNHQNYRFGIALNFCKDLKEEEVMKSLSEQKLLQAKKQVSNTPMFDLPSRFWQQLVGVTLAGEQKTWADSTKKELQQLAQALTGLILQVNGKSTFKEEFVTSGGISLKEVDFKTMESKKVKGLYFAGEVLDIDALTGGFNFQAAWSEAWIISESIGQ